MTLLTGLTQTLIFSPQLYYTYALQVRVKDAQPCATSSKPAPIEFPVYNPRGMDCLEDGILSTMSSPSRDECFIYCSTHMAGLSTIWFFKVIEYPSSGSTECYCMGNQCTLASPSSPNGGRGRRGLLPLRIKQAQVSVQKSNRQLQDEKPVVTVYQANDLATSWPTNVPTMQPTSMPTTDPSSQPTLQPTTDPTSQPTLQPSALPSGTPTLSPTQSPTTSSIKLLEEGPNPALLNAQQLALGYNSFLGVLPHEQQGTYMRRPSK